MSRPSAPALRVASFNIRTSTAPDGEHAWTHRRDACLTVIRDLRADVVGLQEVQPDQLADVREAFPTHHLVGAGRGAGGGDEHAAVLVDENWTVQSTSTRWLSATPDVAGSIGWDADLPRVATIVRLRHGARTVGVVNTHLDHIGEQARVRGAELIVDWTAAEPDRHWIVTGDLNATPGSPPVLVFTEAGFTDTLPADALGTEHAFTGATDRTRIDYVLAGPGVVTGPGRVVTERPNGRLPSDHWPVVAELDVG